MGLPGRASLLLTPGDAEKNRLVELHKSGLVLFQGLKIDYGSCGSGGPDGLKLPLCQSPARQQFSRKAILLCLASLRPMTVVLLPGQTGDAEGGRAAPKTPGPLLTPRGES